ncbi:MAG: hypothetical protein BRD38_05590 [Bacteroidetes bacterium QH_9_67_14]|nr:MAG: hypothetical protein BRD38_05590 [Bacteroidetes bacterium QH_9_67_14]
MTVDESGATPARLLLPFSDRLRRTVLERLLSLLPHASSSGRRATLLALSFLALAGVVFALPVAHAQSADAQETGAIEGVVVNGKTGETLPGANVVVVGEQKGASTGVDGGYRIDGLAPGAYDLKCSFVSYQPKTITGVEVAAGETTTLDVTLNAQTQEREEVVVTAEVARNSEAGLLAERQKAAGVSNAISAEGISESGASTAAGAMEKVTGASITEGKHVNVRGLSGRYVNTTLNGAALPSTEADGNATSFDIFPSNLLENIVVSKTFTPDKPGNFTGGLVDIGTVAFPSDLNLSLSSSAGYNTAVSYGNGVRFSEGLPDVPGVVPQTGVPEVPKFHSAEQAQQADRITNAFNANLAPASGGVPYEHGYELSFGNEFSFLGERPLGVVASFSYDQNISAYDDGLTARHPLSSTGADSLTTDLRLEDQSSTVEDLYSALANTSFQPFDNHEIGVNLLYTRSEERQGRFQEGFGRELLSGGDVFQTRTIQKTVRDVRSGQVHGEHTFGREALGALLGTDLSQGLRLKWKGAITRTKQDQPDYRLFANEVNDDGTFAGINVSGYSPPARYFRDFDQETPSAEASLDIPLAVLDLKVGGSYRNKDRAFRQRRFIYKNYSESALDYQGDLDAFFGANGGFRDGMDELGNVIQESASSVNNYNGAQEVAAGFAMVDMAVPGVPGLRLVGGVRVERTDQQIEVYPSDAPLRYPLADSLFRFPEPPPGRAEPPAPGPGRIEQTDWLPSANLTYALSDEMNLRATYGRTLARPSFKEFAPIRFSNFTGAYPEIGNPNLDRTLVDNFDLRWEWFPRPGELLAASGFYKTFDGAIERSFVPVNNPVVTYFNSERATVYGAEFEARTRFKFLDDAASLGDAASWLEHLKAGANLTLAQSSVDVPDSLQTGQDTRPLQGQSPYLVNANLAYDRPEWGTSAGFYYNVFGQRLTAITRDAGPNRFEQPRHTLDFTFAQRMKPLGLGGLEVTFKAKNLLGEDHLVTRQYRGATYPVRRHDLGRSFTLGLEYSL